MTNIYYHCLWHFIYKQLSYKLYNFSNEITWNIQCFLFIADKKKIKKGGPKSKFANSKSPPNATVGTWCALQEVFIKRVLPRSLPLTTTSTTPTTIILKFMILKFQKDAVCVWVENVCHALLPLYCENAATMSVTAQSRLRTTTTQLLLQKKKTTNIYFVYKNLKKMIISYISSIKHCNRFNLFSFLFMWGWLFSTVTFSRLSAKGNSFNACLTLFFLNFLS